MNKTLWYQAFPFGPEQSVVHGRYTVVQFSFMSPLCRMWEARERGERFVMMSDASWEWIKRVGTITSLTGAAIGVGFFFFNQNQRISTLEAQMQAATITTTLRNASKSASNDPAEKSVSNAGAIVDVNPIVQACA